jgi:mannose-1-phosphate guanylyltransferase
MAGGRGERLWPLSTDECPKQFLKLIGERTMLQETVERVRPLVPPQDALVVVGKEHAHFVFEQIPDLPRRNLIAEPMGRGTAPCVGLAALHVSRIDPKGVMLVLPADHVIKKRERFLRLLKEAVAIASEGKFLVTLGIPPTFSATGYGYIRASRPYQNATYGRETTALAVERFTEKPDRATAERFLNEGGYYWNSGMFIWRADAILHEIEEHMPDLHRGLEEIAQHLGRLDEDAVIREVYSRQESFSIDHGVMEKSRRTCVLPTGDIGWSDVGDWSALESVLPKDEKGNVVLADHRGIDTRGTTVVSDRTRPVVTIGVRDLVIVDTSEALLVMDRSRAQDVKKIRNVPNGGR